MAFICSCHLAQQEDERAHTPLIRIGGAKDFRSRLAGDLLPAYASALEARDPQVRQRVLHALVLGRSLATVCEELERTRLERQPLQYAIAFREFGKLKPPVEPGQRLSRRAALKLADPSRRSDAAACALAYLRENGMAVARLLLPRSEPSLEQQIVSDAYALAERREPGLASGKLREHVKDEAKQLLDRTQKLPPESLEALEDLLYGWRYDLPLICDAYFFEPPPKVLPGQVEILMQLTHDDGLPLSRFHYRIEAGETPLACGETSMEGVLSAAVPLGDGRAQLKLWRNDESRASEVDLDLASFAIDAKD